MIEKVMFRIVLLWFGSVLLFACQKGDSVRDNKVLATVFDRNLYLSDLETMIPEGATAEDSTLIINAFVERWVRDAALAHEAELAIPKDLNIDKLVADYRSSLAKNNYEKTLIQQFLDSVVTEQDYLSYYEQHKQQFSLKSPLFKSYFLKIPKKTKGIDKVKKWLKKDNVQHIDEIKSFAINAGALYLLNDSVWYQANELIAKFPKDAIGQHELVSKKMITYSDENFKYFLKILNKTDAGEVSPLEKVRNQIKLVILHQRKKKLLREKKEALYERAMRGNNIKIRSNK